AIYTQLFALYDQKIAQVLLTREDLSDRRRYLNARGTLEALLSMGVIPIINENDTVATEEIRFGDNDRLSALVANVLEADLLVLLTDQDGVYTADPRANPEAKLITQVDTPEIPSALMNGAEDSTTGLGTGGMITKLNAADLARRSGAEVMIVNGNADNILHRVVVDHEAAGTFFTSLISHMESRKRYLLSGMQGAVGALRIDRGAVDALRSGGSLLPVGIRQVVGGFTRGDTCKIQDQDGNDIAVGLCAYTSEEVERLIGLRSDQIESQLGYTYGAEVIHRDNMVLL
ncbi:MAG: glutamate 5-kinase, partial [Anaerolineaceae bacterium]|nr:glutamate 5-kinase [Anaerolineaceae bacterium]